MNLSKIFLQLNSLFFKVPYFLFMLFCAAYLFFRASEVNSYDDPTLELKIIDKEKQQEFGTFAAKVTVGMLVKNFVTFDVIRNNFIVDVTLWFDYNADQVMLDTISQFSFDNGEIIRRSNPDIRFKGSRATVEYDLRIGFKSNLGFKRFPLENHKISLILSNNFVTPAELYFVAEDAGFKVSPSVYISDWVVKDVNTDAGYLEVGLEGSAGKIVANPKARFTFNIKKRGLKDAFVIFLPLYLATAIGVFSFMTGFGGSSRYIMASSPVPALLGYRFVIQNLIPLVSYFTITDNIFLLLLIISFFIFMFQTIIGRYASFVEQEKNFAKKEKYRQLLQQINTLVFALVILAVLVGTYFFVVWI